MPIGGLSVNKTARLGVTVFVTVCIFVYIILALSTVHTSLKPRYYDLPKCISESGAIVVQEKYRNLAGVGLPPPIEEYDLNMNEIVQIADGNNKNAFIIEDNFAASNDSKQNNTLKTKNKRKYKHRYISKPDDTRFIAKPGKRKQIMTRFGLLDIMALNDRTDLTVSERLLVSKVFSLDAFPEEVLNKSTKEILTFKDRDQVYKNWKKTDSSKPIEKPLCPNIPLNLKGKFEDKLDDFNQPTFDDIAAANPRLILGGKYTPPCHPRSKIAIIIPFRGREPQLKTLLAHMHPIWQRQEIEYAVYVISQQDNFVTFNKAKLMNAGFLEASKYDTYDCFVFHDVDLLVEDDRCLYRCPDSDNARIIAARMDKFDYKELQFRLPCSPEEFPEDVLAIYFGGVAMMTSKQFYDVNGYSNLYWGWGSEDIDIFLRLWHRGYDIVQPYGKMCSFHMIKHKRDEANQENLGRFALLANSVNRMKFDGLTSLRYKILSVNRNKLFTNITISVGRPSSEIMQFMNRKFVSQQCNALLPWLAT